MNKYLKYLKALLYIIISILTLNIFISAFYYFNIIKDNTLTILRIITIIISMFIGGIYIGNKTNKKGYLEGIKISLIMIILLFLISYLGFGKSIKINTLIYYLIILISTTIGSMIGINKKR